MIIHHKCNGSLHVDCSTRKNAREVAHILREGGYNTSVKRMYRTSSWMPSGWYVWRVRAWV